jgi:hypothetical protein
MKKNILIGLVAAVLVFAIGIATFGVINVQAARGSFTQALGFSGGNGRGQNTNTGMGNQQAIDSNLLASIPSSELSADESAALLFMREEEKLARDVYTQLYATWGQTSFQRISSSEQQHMDQIGLLLTRYNLSDPAKTPGVFTNPDLQKLYTSLIAQGNQSLVEAYKVGGAIEEIDIRDLQTRIAKTDNADIQLVYNNLLNASYNHLNAYARQYSNQTGSTYTAQFLSASQLQSILANGMGNGRGNSNSGMGNRGGGMGNGMGNRNNQTQP